MIQYVKSWLIKTSTNKPQLDGARIRDCIEVFRTVSKNWTSDDASVSVSSSNYTCNAKMASSASVLLINIPKFSTATHLSSHELSLLVLNDWMSESRPYFHFGHAIRDLFTRSHDFFCFTDQVTAIQEYIRWMQSIDEWDWEWEYNLFTYVRD